MRKNGRVCCARLLPFERAERPHRSNGRAAGSRAMIPADSKLEAGVAEEGIGLADAIAALRDDMAKASAASAGQDIQFPIESMTVELKVVATVRADGRAGFSVPIVKVELGGSGGWQRESMQTVTVVFAPPVDAEGNPIKVASSSNQLKG